jgi:hypothetical protein
MSILDESQNLSNIFDPEDDLKSSPRPFEELEDFSFIKNRKEESHSSYTLNDKMGNPLYINNENFINYFMHIDYNTPLDTPNKNDINITQSNSANPIKETNDSNDINKNKNSNLLKKTKRDKEYGIITDNLTGITYYEEEDPVNFRKAKKRIQNRESALRMKKLKENNSSKIDEELSRLKEDNLRLINENISLKKEKIFLIDQIKFMQKIIKESNLEFKLKNLDNNIIVDNDNLNDNKYKEPILYYDGSKQKIKGKLFNVFIVCILSIVYIAGECAYDGEKVKNNQNRDRGNAIQLNSVDNGKEKSIKNSVWFYVSKIILVIIIFFIIPWFKDIIQKIRELVKERRKKKYI